MFDQFRLKDVLAHYKQNFVSTQWGNEKYKWEAAKWFQDNWDVNAQNFPEMLNRSLDKTFNLLASSNNFPKGMIVGFAKAAPEEVRAMFIALFDESKDVYERMNAFKLQSSILLEKYGNGAAQHYQYENAISTYLWLRYPDIEYTFHAFCKIVIRNASYTALRTWSRKHKREISLDYITDEKHYPLGTTDEYFKAPEPDEEYIVHLCGDTVILSNGLLVQALSRLPAQKQEMLYLSFFKRMPQHEIGRRYGRSRSAAGYHIRKAIQQLYEEMEGLAHEE